MSGLPGVCIAQGPLEQRITYQGELKADGAPADGVFDMRFSIFDALAGGAQIAGTVCADGVSVAQGRFSVVLDFTGLGPSPFAGDERFIEVQVRPESGLDCTNATGFSTLAPRQELSADPYALHALTAGTANSAATALTATNLNGQPSTFYTNASNIASGTLPDARLSTNIPRENASNTFTAQQTFTRNIVVNGTLSTTPLLDVSSTGTLGARASTSSSTANAAALVGIASGASGQTFGGTFQNASSTTGVGVLGEALAPLGTTRGVWGRVTSPSGFAGYFEGRGFFSGRLSVTSTVSATGYEFPDGSTQTRSALDPGESGYESGYRTNPQSFVVRINGTIVPGATLVGELEITQPLDLNTGLPTGQKQVTDEPVLRRMRTSDQTWFDNARLGVIVPSIALELTSGTSTFTWTFTNIKMVDYRLNLSDDGIPVEEVAFTVVPSTQPVRVKTGSFATDLPPTADPRAGFVSGYVINDAYRPRVLGVQDDNAVVVSDVFFNHPTGGSGLASPSTVSLRVNAKTTTDYHTWFTSTTPQSFDLVIEEDSPPATIIALPAVSTRVIQYRLRVADDGMPVEEYEIFLPIP